MTMNDDQMWAPTVGVVMPDPVPRPTIRIGPVTCDHGAVNWRPEPTHPRCAAVDSFGRTYDGAICPVHGGSRCPVDLEEREPARLHPDDIEAIARRVAELLRGRP